MSESEKALHLLARMYNLHVNGVEPTQEQIESIITRAIEAGKENHDS